MDINVGVQIMNILGVDYKSYGPVSYRGKYRFVRTISSLGPGVLRSIF